MNIYTSSVWRLRVGEEECQQNVKVQSMDIMLCYNYSSLLEYTHSGVLQQGHIPISAWWRDGRHAIAQRSQDD